MTDWLDPQQVREFFDDPLNRHVSFTSLISGAWEQFGLAVAAHWAHGTDCKSLKFGEVFNESLCNCSRKVARIIRDAQEGK